MGTSQLSHAKKNVKAFLLRKLKHDLKLQKGRAIIRAIPNSVDFEAYQTIQKIHSFQKYQKPLVLRPNSRRQEFYLTVGLLFLARSGALLIFLPNPC